MKKNNTLFLLALFITLTTTRNVVVLAGPDETVVTCLCGPEQSSSDKKVSATLASTNDVIENTNPGGSGFCGYSDVISNEIIFAYGSCSARISKDDCKACLTHAQSQLTDVLCKEKYGAQLKMVDCSMRYEEYIFC